MIFPTEECTFKMTEIDDPIHRTGLIQVVEKRIDEISTFFFTVTILKRQ